MTRFQFWPIAALALSAALLPSCTLAQTQTKAPDAPALYGDWRSSHIGGGGYIQNVVFTRNPNVLYSYVDVGGVFRSDDGGRRWRMLHGTLQGAGSGVAYVRDVNVDPRDENRVTLVCGTQWGAQEGIFQSLDGGKSWQKRQSAWFYGNEDFRWSGRGLARNPKNPDELLAFSAGDGVFRSVDGGVTWAKTGLEKLFPSEIQWSRDGQTVLAFAQSKTVWQNGVEAKLEGGLFRSENGGKSWAKIADNAPLEAIEDLQTTGKWWAASGGNGISVSLDNGANWVKSSDGLPQENDASFTSESKFDSIAMGRDERGFFLITASARGTFYRRDLPGEKWEKLPAPVVEAVYEGREWGSADKPGRWPKFGAALGSIQINPRDPKQWFFTDWFSIRRSDDAGKSWKLSMDGVEVTVLHALLPDPKDAGRVHLGMGDNGYMLSTDGAASYAKAHLVSNMKGLSVPSSRPARVYGVGDDNSGKWRSFQLWISDDAGQNWTKSPMRGLPDNQKHSFNSVVAPPNSPEMVFVAASEKIGEGGGVYRSTDGGFSFAPLNDGLPPNDKFFTGSIWEIGREFAALPNGDVLAMSRWQGALYLLKNGASKWEKIAAELPSGGPFDVAASETAFFVAVQKSGVWKVENGAAKRIFEADASRVAVSPFDPNRVATGTQGGVYESSDGGKTWQKRALLPNSFGAIVAFTRDRLLAGTPGNGAFWRPLNANGEKPIAAQDVAARKLEIPLPLAQKLEENFAVVWTGSGALEVVRIIETEAPKTVALSTKNARAQGSMATQIPVWSGAKTFSGRARSGGEWEEALVALQIFDATGKQIGWQTLLDAKSAREWTNFSAEARLPEGAKSVNLTVIGNGNGQISLRDLGAN